MVRAWRLYLWSDHRLVWYRHRSDWLNVPETLHQYDLRGLQVDLPHHLSHVH